MAMQYPRSQHVPATGPSRATARKLPTAKGVSDRIRSAVLIGRRSRLYLWMAANFDQFSATLAEAGRPNWQALLEAFREERLADKEMTAEKVRLTWFAVRAAVAKDQDLPAKLHALMVQEKHPARPPATPVAPVEDQLKPAMAVPRQTGPRASPRPAYDFRPASLKPRKDED
jgi:hypothetical protein